MCYSKYPKDWKLRSLFVREYRAKGRCEWCGIENGSIRPETGAKVVLSTAHVFDKRPAKASLLNLAALCQKCHTKHDAKQHAATTRVNKRRKQAVIDLYVKDSSMIATRSKKFLITKTDKQWKSLIRIKDKQMDIVKALKTR